MKFKERKKSKSVNMICPFLFVLIPDTFSLFFRMLVEFKFIDTSRGVFYSLSWYAQQLFNSIGIKNLGVFSKKM